MPFIHPQIKLFILVRHTRSYCTFISTSPSLLAYVTMRDLFLLSFKLISHNKYKQNYTMMWVVSVILLHFHHNFYTQGTICNYSKESCTLHKGI